MQRTMRSIRRWALVSGLSMACGISNAQEPYPTGSVDGAAHQQASRSTEVLLVVEGAIQGGDSAGEARLNLQALQRLPPHSLLTTTAVTDGVRRFDGFLMRDVMKLVDARGTVVEARALNHYSVDIPIADFHDYDVLLATHMDGKRLEVSGKGPFWIVYPRDDWRQLQDIRYDYRWVWQLHRLTVK